MPVWAAPAMTYAGETPYPGDAWAADNALPPEMPCPKTHLHTPAPVGYLAWHAWAERKSRRHYQVRCPGCGLLMIWRRKPTWADR